MDTWKQQASARFPYGPPVVKSYAYCLELIKLQMINRWPAEQSSFCKQYASAAPLRISDRLAWLRTLIAKSELIDNKPKKNRIIIVWSPRKPRPNRSKVRRLRVPFHLKYIVPQVTQSWKLNKISWSSCACGERSRARAINELINLGLMKRRWLCD